ncbi:hypothetical protein GCM10027614_76180 [Micromonospora vulcania]
MQAVNEPMADVRDMYMAHTMFRREFRLLPQLVRDVVPGDTQRAEVVANHADTVCHILHVHHEGEDMALWPRLVERGGKRPPPSCRRWRGSITASRAPWPR